MPNSLSHSLAGAASGSPMRAMAERPASFAPDGRTNPDWTGSPRRFGPRPVWRPRLARAAALCRGLCGMRPCARKRAFLRGRDRTDLVGKMVVRAFRQGPRAERSRSEKSLGEKAQDASIGIGTIEQMVKAKDPLYPREAVRRLAREIGIAGKRGRRRKNSSK